MENGGWSMEGVDLSEAQVDFLDKAAKGDATLRPETASVVSRLAALGLIAVLPGVRNDPRDRRRDAALPVWRRRPEVFLTDVGRALVASPRRAPRHLRPPPRIEGMLWNGFSWSLPGGDDATPERVARIERDHAVLLSATRSYNRRVVMLCLLEFNDGEYAGLDSFVRHVLIAWNDGVVARIPRTRNPLFVEMRARLPFLETRKDMTRARRAVDLLRRLIDPETTAGGHLALASAFLDQAGLAFPAESAGRDGRRCAVGYPNASPMASASPSS